MSRLVLDIETNAIHMPDKLWCVVTQDVDTGEVKTYHGQDNNRQNCRSLVRDITYNTTLIGHNIIGYDLPHLSRLVDDFIYSPLLVIDTLILARLRHAGIPNSLEAWGKRLDFPKGNFKEFSSYSPEMLEYCKQDVALTAKLFLYLEDKLKVDNWKQSIETEHKVSWLLLNMKKNGFFFDKEAAKKIHKKVVTEKEKLDGRLQNIFQPVTRLIREVTPRLTRSGTLHSGDFRWMSEDQPDLTGYTAGHTFSRFSWVPFNPQSPKQIIDRIRKYGWNPTEKTKGHTTLLREIRDRRIKTHQLPTFEQQERIKMYSVYGWRINEVNLSTISPDAPPEAHELIRRLLLGNRTSVIESWLEAYNPSSGKIHGDFIGIGAWTQRMAHRNPNMANIPRPDTEFGEEMRKLWTSGPSLWLVGCDASGIQLRVLAHYINNADFTHAVCKGTEEERTDIHTLNAELLSISRNEAKRWIYAWLLGAGPDKLAFLSNTTRGQAIEFSDQFMDRYTGLRQLKEGQIRQDAQRRYFKGLDGRFVISPSEHHMLAGMLQNGEATIMKMATIEWNKQLHDRRIPFWPCNLVHDEWQTRGHEIDTHIIGEIQCQSLQTVGHQLNLRCPLDGNYKVGKTWFETH